MKKETFRIVKHIVGIIISLLLPLIIESEEITCCEYIMRASVIVSYLIIFYLNYYIFIDRWLYNSKKRPFFIFINLIVVLALWFILEYWRNVHFQIHILPSEYLERLQPPPSKYVMALKDVWLGFLIVGLSIALRVSENYFMLKEQTKELIRLRAETELAELKHQLNPHFLFNTLNNIYALIGLSQQKAQNAVLDLSKLLRYALYEGDKDTVALEYDLQFVRNYIDLMQLRVGKSVVVNVDIPVDTSNLYIAPMLFITLVENAFKHGISGNCNSIINIAIHSCGNSVECVVMNTVQNVDNEISDRTGIGLENLIKRLELLYHDRYEYSGSSVNGVYTAKLKIELTDEKAKLCCN